MNELNAKRFQVQVGVWVKHPLDSMRYFPSNMISGRTTARSNSLDGKEDAVKNFLSDANPLKLSLSAPKFGAFKSEFAEKWRVIVESKMRVGVLRVWDSLFCRVTKLAQEFRTDR